MSYPQLNQQLIKNRYAAGNDTHINLHLPLPQTFELPEKIMQFGSGAFLRAFFDYFIHIANQQKEFNGRIVVVQSTGANRSQILKDQDGLYTLCAQGLQNNRPVEEFTVCSAISRAISAADDWQSVLAFAESPDLEIVVSNTTEAGIVFDEEDRIDKNPPRSFPGKLTAVLHRRFAAFNGDPSRGLVILPCELLEDNGRVLRDLVLRLADMWQLGGDFKDWVVGANQFCNTLVDRIVPGKPDAERLKTFFEKLNFSDDLLTCAELYSLFAIEGDAGLPDKLKFCRSNPAIFVREDISAFRERKLRLLNAAHTISVPLAHFAGLRYVIDMMNDRLLSQFVEQVMREEIAPCLEMEATVVSDYINAVLDRFQNPFLKHALLDITLQSTVKMRYRVLPVINRYRQKFNKMPECICLGFAAYLRFMKAEKVENGRYWGQYKGAFYPINDAAAAYFNEQWQAASENGSANAENLVKSVCQNRKLWEMDLSDLPDFIERVSSFLIYLLREEDKHALEQALNTPSHR